MRTKTYHTPSGEGFLHGYWTLCVFEHGGTTNILYPFDDVTPETLEMGKLATWRLNTHENFSGTWHSDYIINNLDIGIAKNYLVEGFTVETAISDIIGLKVGITNSKTPDIGGLVVPIPISQEALKPFIEGLNIKNWRDVKIYDIKSDIENLGEKLFDVVCDAGTQEYSLEELNYLAAKVAKIVDNGGYDGDIIIPANIEAGINCDTVAGIINLTFSENLNKLDVFPTYDAQGYGDILVNHFMADEHADVFNRLLRKEKSK